MKHIKLFEAFGKADNTQMSKDVMKVATPEQKAVLDDLQSGTEVFFFDMLRRLDDGITPESIDKALETMVNDVEGDETQLEDEHAKYAKKKGWL